MLKKVTMLILASILVAGCTHTINPPDEAFSGYPQNDKLPMKVKLVLTDEFAKSCQEWQRGDTYVIPIGGCLVNNSKVLSQQVFQQVVVGEERYDAVLSPKVVYINQTIGATSLGDSIIDVKIEWSLKDATGNYLWVETVNGEANGLSAPIHYDGTLKRAVEDLFLNSYKAMLTSKVISQYAIKKSKNANATQ